MFQLGAHHLRVTTHQQGSTAASSSSTVGSVETATSDPLSGATSFGHDGDVGQADDKPRKRRNPLRKVPKYETPNTLPLPGLTGESEFGRSSGRFGHGSDGKEYGRPGLIGRGFLRVLGMRQRRAGVEGPVTAESEE
jgi:hypothetical protein